MTIPELIYLLCAAASLAAALLLLRRYQTSRTPLLLWSFIGFVGLAANNVLVYVDLVMVPSIDLAVIRGGVAAAALMALLYGMVWERRR